MLFGDNYIREVSESNPKQKTILLIIVTVNNWTQKQHLKLSPASSYAALRIRLFSIPDPESELSPSRIPEPHQRI